MRPWIAADRYDRPGSPACIDDPEFCGYYSLGAWEYEASPALTDAVTARAAEIRHQLDGGPVCADPCGGD